MKSEKRTGEVLARLVVVADTHVPDKVEGLPPHFLEMLAAIVPTAILHAGDISTMSVLGELSAVAPVIAVRGNRDFRLYRQLPLIARAEFGGVKLAVTHGHGGVRRYILDKFQYISRGYEFAFHQRYLLRTLPDVDVIVFGHTHVPELVRVEKQLFFNPGSLIGSQGFDPVYGVLEIRSGKEVNGKHVLLTGVERKGRNWVEL
ncbi:MAG: metallophosphatase family protein [Anaerolineaceae bacterium]|nr:metallophosphatase family protein [Anaerolineaceae bacterium]